MKPRSIVALTALAACLVAGGLAGPWCGPAFAHDPAKPAAGAKKDAPAPTAPAPPPADAPTASPPDTAPAPILGPARQLEEVPDLFAPAPVKGPDDPVTEFSIES